ncbi:MAG: ATP-binding cassette domain-containing protein, partial [Prevotellaceae bacterium]|nr:ATP-binding cassette domain-containing protein [Prevotellaceae bacterium]
MLAHYIKRIEIHALWNRTNIAWDLRPDVNILSGLNGVGKSTILNRSVDYLTVASGELTGHGMKGVNITFDNPEADAIPFDYIHSYAYSAEQADELSRLVEGYTRQALRSGSKQKFQEMADQLFGYTGKSIDRTAADLRFVQAGDTILPAQLSAGEKQMLIILLTALKRDGAYCVLF